MIIYKTEKEDVLEITGFYRTEEGKRRVDIEVVNGEVRWGDVSATEPVNITERA
jgi:hypothetical protein